MRYRPMPCAECPWRRDTPPRQFPRERYEELRETVGAPGDEVPLGGPMFACHKSTERDEIPCAGWLAVVGYEHLTVRLAIIEGVLPVGVLRPGKGWPEMFTSYDELIEHQAG